MLSARVTSHANWPIVWLFAQAHATSSWWWWLWWLSLADIWRCSFMSFTSCHASSVVMRACLRLDLHTNSINSNPWKRERQREIDGSDFALELERCFAARHCTNYAFTLTARNPLEFDTLNVFIPLRLIAKMPQRRRALNLWRNGRVHGVGVG